MRVILILLCLALFSAVVSAQTVESIPDFAAARAEMELTKGAISRTIGVTVLNTYIPDFGVVFIFTVSSDKTVEVARAEIERAMRFLGPSLERLKDDEKIVMIAQREGFTETWEVMYITTKATVGDPSSWKVYVSRSR